MALTFDPAQFAPEYADIRTSTNPFLTGAVGQSPVFQQAVEQFKALTQPIIQQQFALQGNGQSPALGQALGISLGNALIPLMSQDMQNRLSAIGLAQQRLAQQQQPVLQESLLGQELASREALQRAQIASQEQMLGRQLTAQEQAQLRELGFRRQQETGMFDTTPTIAGRAQSLAEFTQPEELRQLAALRAGQVADASAGRQLQALGLAGQYGQYAGSQLQNLADLTRQRQELSLQGYGSAGQAQRDVQQQANDAAYGDYLRRQALSEQTTTGLFGGSVLPPTIQQSSRTKTSSSK